MSHKLLEGGDFILYYAHSDKDIEKKYWQRLNMHLQSVSKLSKDFANDFNTGIYGEIAGLMHDLGKYSSEFQRRLEGENIRVDHSTAGAQEAVEKYGNVYGKLLAYIIAGHHSGLPDWGSMANEVSLCSRLKKTDIPSYQDYKKEIRLPEKINARLPIKPLSKNPGFSFSFIIRMLYSCLTDADFLDTERALNTEKTSMRGTYDSLENMYEKLKYYLFEKQMNSCKTLINKKRGDILDDCITKSKLPPNLFTLTVPTGGGKTLSSLAFALNHAIVNGMKRVIYVIPYTSIIEQNAAVFREIVGKENVVEHHSNYHISNEDSEDALEVFEKIKLSSENWDAPLIVTTNVQFFESLFANRSSKCRKLHNISKSVIILDEAQMLPVDYLKPCLAALSELVVNYNSSIILCTATQPAIKSLLPDDIRTQEIVNNTEELYKVFERVQINKLGNITDEELILKLENGRQALCIVNTRKHAKRLYQLLKGRNNYHLSALMCPAHRMNVLGEIRKRLQLKEECRVISTQIIEAGVDVDFPVVYRSSAGIDSIAQAAGRCNREGKLIRGQVFVFMPEKHGMPRGWISRTASVGSSVLDEYDNPLSLEAVRDYFNRLYSIDASELDRKGIMKELEKNASTLGFDFADIAEKFKLIESNTISIIIPYDDKCKDLIEKARWSSYPGSYARAFQPYTVQVYPNEYIDLLKNNAIENLSGIYNILIDMQYYSGEFGLNTDENSELGGDVLLI